MAGSTSSTTVSVVLGVLLGGGVLLLWLWHTSSGWLVKATKSGARLPDGSFGWPLLGESVSLVRNPVQYGATRAKRYGSVFKSSLFFRPTIIGTTPEFAKLVLTNSTLFKSGWPACVTEVLGPKAFPFKDGPEHLAMRKVVQKCVTQEALGNRIQNLEASILANLASWSKEDTVIAAQAMQRITLDVGLKVLLGIDNIGSTAEGREALENFRTLNAAIRAVPVNFPGTRYHRALKARVKLTTYMTKLLEKKRTEVNDQNSILGVLMAAQEDPAAREEIKELDDETIIDNLVGVWFAFYGTTSNTMTWILKYLMDYPEVYRLVEAEHLEILRGKESKFGEPRLTRTDLRNMVYTSKVIQEVHRKISISSILARKATQDVEFDGHLIPKGWIVYAMITSIHTDPANYKDPLTFNPSRFDEPPKPSTYLPFSAGPHLCPGIELVRLLASICIHHLITTYEYQNSGGDKGMTFLSFPSVVGGYPITIRPRK